MSKIRASDSQTSLNSIASVETTDIDFYVSKEEMVRLYSMEYSELHKENMEEFQKFKVRSIRMLVNYFKTQDHINITLR